MRDQGQPHAVERRCAVHHLLDRVGRRRAVRRVGPIEEGVDQDPRAARRDEDAGIRDVVKRERRPAGVRSGPGHRIRYLLCGQPAFLGRVTTADVGSPTVTVRSRSRPAGPPAQASCSSTASSRLLLPWDRAPAPVCTKYDESRSGPDSRQRPRSVLDVNEITPGVISRPGSGDPRQDASGRAAGLLRRQAQARGGDCRRERGRRRGQPGRSGVEVGKGQSHPEGRRDE